MLWRTSFGLRLRSCGESPMAAESLGVNVYLYKYAAVIVSGALAGLGGAFLAIVAGNIYREGQTGGRGYIGLAAMIFGNWRPGGLAARRRPVRLHRRAAAAPRRRVRARAAAAGRRRRCSRWPSGCFVATQAGRRSDRPSSSASARSVWYFTTDEVPGDFTTMTPYVTTLLVLALAAQRLRMPAADGLPYRRGQGG